MLRLPSQKAATGLLVSLAAFCAAVPGQLAAQSTSRALVVVTENSVAECVQRIGRDYVHAKLLFTTERGAALSNYDECERRIRGLLGFRLLVIRSDVDCPSLGFWRDRMSAANPQGKVHRISLSPSSAADYSELQIQQATAVHRALVSILPECQAALDANLKAEVRRWNSLRLHPYQVVLRE